MTLPRFTVLPYDGISPMGGGAEPPSADNTVGSVAAAERYFRQWMRDTGNDYTRAEGYGQPWADVVHTGRWDGISYGDITGGDGVVRLTRGPRGGVVRENF